MSLQELRYLIALADEGHFAHAAQKCHVGQSTLSTQLKKLEDYLGVPLFDRSLRHVQPTPVGAQVIAEARVVLRKVDSIRQLARHKQDPTNGPLYLGVNTSLGPYLTPHLIPIVQQTYPNLHLHLREDFSSRLLEQLLCGRLDGLLLARPKAHNGLRLMELFREPFTVALPTGHRLANKNEVQASDLLNECVLTLGEDSNLHEIYSPIQCAQREEVQATSLETLRQMVVEGMGCALLPVLAAKPRTHSFRHEGIEIRPFADPAPSRTIGLVWRRRYPRKDVILKLAELIRANLPPEVTGINRLTKTPVRPTSIESMLEPGGKGQSSQLPGGIRERRKPVSDTYQS